MVAEPAVPLVWPVNGPAEGFRPAPEVVFGSVPDEGVSNGEGKAMTDGHGVLVYDRNGDLAGVGVLDRLSVVSARFALEIASCRSPERLREIEAAFRDEVGEADFLSGMYAAFWVLLTSVAHPSLSELDRVGDNGMRKQIRSTAADFRAILQEMHGGSNG